ncbi:MAG: hypothetical protein AMS24_05290 [Chlamydiae bacterium SM23_39]|nr:MAG: hypothetical protein AMS24_05290 [Chlamydiae bacterium SM23_39]
MNKYNKTKTSIFNVGYHLIWCPKYRTCNKEHNRDVNAAINNLRKGASSLELDIVRPDSSDEYCLNPESNRDVNAAINNLREGASSLELDIVRPDSSDEYCLNPESN